MPGTLSTTAAAVDLAARGLAVFPLPPGGRLPGVGWSRRAMSDPREVPGAWPDGCNIGVGCRASNLVVLDLDVDAAASGVETLRARLAARGEEWPDTLTVATPSGGRHLYFRVPPGCTIGSSSGGRTALGPGIDVRGPGRRSGGYLVGPGSVVDGRRYEVVVDAPALPLPGWIAEVLAGPPAWQRSKLSRRV